MEDNVDKSILHIDFSNNQFDEAEFEIISNELSKNHSIYGFHYEGNYGHTDEKMFLVGPEMPDEEEIVIDEEEEDEEKI